MSISLDASVNAMVGHSMAMSQNQVSSIAQVKLMKSATSSQEAAVLTLLNSAAGLQTYDQSGAMQTVAAVGQVINVTA